MSAETTLPLDLAPLREGAEEMEREYYSLDVSIGGTSLGRWDRMDRYTREICVTARMRLLSDLTRPASRDWWVRWLARHHGLTVGATAPAWGCYVCGEHCADGDTGRMERCSRPIWSLMAADGQDPITFAECGIEAPDDREIIPGISAETDPAAALRLAILAAAGRTEHANPAGSQTGAVASPESAGDDGTRAPAEHTQDGESGGGRVGGPDASGGASGVGVLTNCDTCAHDYDTPHGHGCRRLDNDDADFDAINDWSKRWCSTRRDARPDPGATGCPGHSLAAPSPAAVSTGGTVEGAGAGKPDPLADGAASW